MTRAAPRAIVAIEGMTGMRVETIAYEADVTMIGNLYWPERGYVVLARGEATGLHKSLRLPRKSNPIDKLPRKINID